MGRFCQRRPSPSELLSRWTLIALGLVLVVFVGACAGGDDTDDSSRTDGLIEEQDEEDPADLVFDSSDSIKLAGVSVNPSEIEPGDCFNEYLFLDQSDFVQQVTTVVGCDGPHDREAYFTRQYAGSELDNFPLEEELDQWSQSMCLDEFEEFIGLEYVLSALEIGAIIPTFEGWTDDGDRNVTCYVYPDEGGRLLASVAESGI